MVMRVLDLVDRANISGSLLSMSLPQMCEATSDGDFLLVKSRKVKPTDNSRNTKIVQIYVNNLEDLLPFNFNTPR